MKRDNLKKAAHIALSIALFVCICTSVMPAYAAGPPPATGDLYIHKFVGAPQGASNSGIELDTSLWTATPANTVVFDLYRVGAAVAAIPDWPEIPPIGAYSIVGSNLVVTDSGVTVGVYSLTSAGSVTTGISGSTPADGIAAAEGLARGIFLVVEDAAASKLLGIEDPAGDPLSIVAAISPFLVAVPMTTADGTGWLDEVHVYPKNEEMRIVKSVDAAGGAVSVGDTVTYTLEFFLPGDIGVANVLEFSDELDPALTYVTDSIDVRTISAVTLTKMSGGVGDYDVDYDPPASPGAHGTITVAFSSAGILKLGGLTSVIIEFECVVNSAILAYADLTIGNIATVELTNEHNIVYSIKSGGTVDVYTAAIKVVKQDEGGAALNGAEFKIASSAANAAAGRFIRSDPVTGELFDYDPAPGSDWDLLGVANDYQGETSANITTFSGLIDYDGAAYQTYYLVETKAPAGYNLLSAAKEVTFVGDEVNYTLEVTVKNSAGFVLPQTGGIGTIIWTVCGIVLLGAAAIIFATRKRPAGDSK